MVKRRKNVTVASDEEIPAKLESLLLSGWAFYFADDDAMIQAAEDAVRPKDFITVILTGTGPGRLLTVVHLIKVAPFLDDTVPHREIVRAIHCGSMKDLGPGEKELMVLSVPVPDEHVGMLVQALLEG